MYPALFISLTFVPSSPANAGFFSSLFQSASADEEEIQSSVPEAPHSPFALPLLGSKNISPLGKDAPKNSEETLFASLPITGESALVGSRNPSGTLLSAHEDQITTYTVQAGDTLSSIAVDFGISLNTLLWANDIRNPKSVKAGDVLVILPVTGVKYAVKKGDTIESIARQFKGDADEILRFNGLAIDEALGVGSVLVIPDGELSPSAPPVQKNTPSGSRRSSRFAGLQDLRGYFLRPISGGRRTQGIHGYNGVDLANSCGTPIVAAAGGTVIIARTSGWNGGYGDYVVVGHPNGAQTLYAHMNAVYVNAGKKITQGEEIGLLGSTGNSTGCHVHFEIRGAKNPF